MQLRDYLRNIIMNTDSASDTPTIECKKRNPLLTILRIITITVAGALLAVGTTYALKKVGY